MKISGDEEKRKIEAYLGRVRQGLRGLKQPDIDEIVEELRSHITEKASLDGPATAGRIEATLAALGNPEELADRYRLDGVLARAEVTRSPLELVKNLLRWSTLSVAGGFVLLSSLIGYSIGAAFALSAILKPFHPRTAGLWVLPDGSGGSLISLRLGFGGTAPAGGKEVLGWWLLPIGLGLGCGLIMLTNYFVRWCARRYRNSGARIFSKAISEIK